MCIGVIYIYNIIARMVRKILVEVSDASLSTDILEVTNKRGRIFPDKLKHYAVNRELRQEAGTYLNETLSSIDIARLNMSIEDFPRNIKHIHIHWYRNRRSIDNLPPSLETLAIYSRVTIKYNGLPNSLKYLQLGGSENVLEALPNNLEYLIIGNSFTNKISRLPENLKHLILGVHYDYELPTLPTSLKVINIGSHYNKRLPLLPKTLKSIELGRFYQLPADMIPTQTIKNRNGKIRYYFK